MRRRRRWLSFNVLVPLVIVVTVLLLALLAYAAVNRATQTPPPAAPTEISPTPAAYDWELTLT
ncbi:MAG: hypothetical protein GYB67_03885 [Chloroflexi bacterium]|nr:hypothetical protein [Chloroflexota bacterium]